MKRTLLPFCLLLAVPVATLAQAPPAQDPLTPPTDPTLEPTPPPGETARDRTMTERDTAETTVPREDWGPVAGDKEFSVSGAGSSDDSFDSTTFNISGDLGWYLTDVVAAGIRQSVGFRDFDNGSNWDGATRGYVNWHFPFDPFRPFIGASLGGIYGSGVDETGFAGLETGAKFYVRDRTFIQARVEWQWFFSSMDEVDDAFEDGAFVYNVGVGYHF